MNSIYAIYRTPGFAPGYQPVGKYAIQDYVEGKKVEAAYIAWFTGEVEAKRAQIALSDKQDYANQYRVEELTQEDCEDLGFLAVFHSLVNLSTLLTT